MTIDVDQIHADNVVPYDDIRPEIRSADFMLNIGSGYFSKMIQRATRSPFSHVGFVMRLDVIDRVMLMESVETIGVRTIPLRKYLYDYDNNGNAYPGAVVIARHRRLAELDRVPLANLGQFAADRLGYNYDTDEIARIAARILRSAVGLDGDDELSARDNEFICSEYAGECVAYLGVAIAHDPRGFIAPADFAKDPEVDLVAVLKV